MSIGLPAHLRQKSVSRAFARGGSTIAFMCFVLVLLGVLSIYAHDNSVILWPAALALVPVLITVALVNRGRTLFLSVAHIFISGPAIYLFAFTVISELEPLGEAGMYLLNLSRIALMLVGGAGLTAVSSVVWCTLGLLVAETAVTIAALQLLGTTVFDAKVYVSYAAVVAVLTTFHLSQRGVRRVQSDLHRAARDDELARLRYEIESTSTAMVHDTVLGHLAAIANAPYGAISAQLQRQMARDLEILVGEEWLSGPVAEQENTGHTAWQNSELLTAVSEARELGLDVDLTGDLTALSRLAGPAAAAVGPAVKQCLVNVIKHSGAMHAEVAIFGSPAEVSVLVVDAGQGFDQAETGEDRLGLRQSVRRRIELVEGTVQLWSTPGRGTSVMIRVPVAINELSQQGRVAT
ncbi:ATP-binding protein [Salinibacterium sp. TMP30]|uniref:sensor histidine kinase n=1 Tax=Salinibacterium sp. TMP30 TaxID=3138237 RepID=UPI0031397771